MRNSVKVKIEGRQWLRTATATSKEAYPFPHIEVELTRQQVEEALRELNTPEFSVGDIVTVKHIAYVVLQVPNQHFLTVGGRGSAERIHVSKAHKVGELSHYETKAKGKPYDHDDAEAEG